MRKFFEKIKQFSLVASQKIKKALVALNHFFSLYEKIWLSLFFSAGIIITIITHDTFLNLAVLFAGLLMELTLAKRSRWCFLFVFLNSTGLIIIGAMNNLYSEMLINLLFWIPYAIVGFILWNKNLDATEDKKLTVVKSLKWYQTLLLVGAVLLLGYAWSFALKQMGDSQPLLDAFSTFFQLVTGILILTRLKQQWWFWMGYILVSATIWVLLGQWVLLIISFGYFSNSVYGMISWGKYIKTSEQKQEVKEPEKNPQTPAQK